MIREQDEEEEDEKSGTISFLPTHKLYLTLICKFNPGKQATLNKAELGSYQWGIWIVMLMCLDAFCSGGGFVLSDLACDEYDGCSYETNTGTSTTLDCTLSHLYGKESSSNKD
nr:hypothetical protein [Tanacetum cinerariifolium]